MIICKEFVLDEVISITAIPVNDYDLATLEWQMKPTIPYSAFSPTLSNAVTIGQNPLFPEGVLIPIIRSSGKATDEESDSVAGRQHETKVSCLVDSRGVSVWDHLLFLERTPSHLLLTFRDKTRAFIISTLDSYSCEIARDGAKTTVSFIIYNHMGIQMLDEERQREDTGIPERL